MRLRLALVAIPVALSLTACGGDKTPTASTTGSAAPSSAGASAIPSITESTPAAALTAEQVVAKLSAKVRSAKLSIVFDEKTDPNSVMGRPGQYISKAAFTDSRVDRQSVRDGSKGSTDLGGGVEVFATSDAASTRAHYLADVTKSNPLVAGPEYEYVAGPIVMRVSSALTPSQARDYADAFKDFAGGNVEGPTEPK